MSSKNNKDSISIAVDIGGSNIRVASINKTGEILKVIKAKTIRTGNSGQVITQQVITLIEQLISQANNSKFIGIGVSAIGPQNNKKGTIINAPNMAFPYIEITKPIHNKFNLSLKLLNDCTAGVLGEKYFGEYKNTKNLVYLTISTGIGAGVICNNHLITGRGNAAEIGHSIVDTKYNFNCSCGKGKGHWESFCSGSSLPIFLKKWCEYNHIQDNQLTNIKTATQIFDLAKHNHKITKNFLKEVQRINSVGLSNIIVSYDPEAIVISGSVALENKKMILANLCLDTFLDKPPISISKLGENAPILGAAAVVLFQ
jgi:glucokinase